MWSQLPILNSAIIQTPDYVSINPQHAKLNRITHAWGIEWCNRVPDLTEVFSFTTAALLRTKVRPSLWMTSDSQAAPSRWWGVCTRRVRNTWRGSRRTPPSSSRGCTRSRTPCPWWTRPNCPSRGRTLWRTWTPGRRVRTTRTALEHGRRDVKDWILWQIFKPLKRFWCAWSVCRFLSTCCWTHWCPFSELTSVQSGLAALPKRRFTTTLHIWK